MAKNNNNKKKQNNRNYFAMQIQKGGDNFLASKTPRDLANDSDRIFRDFVRGVDVHQYKEYILNPALLEILISEAGKKYNYWWGIRVAVDNYIMQLNAQRQGGAIIDQNTEILFGGISNDVIGKFTVYEQLYNCLQIVKLNNAVEPLENLPRVVGNYRYSI